MYRLLMYRLIPPPRKNKVIAIMDHVRTGQHCSLRGQQSIGPGVPATNVLAAE
jgi:hypothetical protein